MNNILTQTGSVNLIIFLLEIIILKDKIVFIHIYYPY